MKPFVLVVVLLMALGVQAQPLMEVPTAQITKIDIEGDLLRVAPNMRAQVIENPGSITELSQHLLVRRVLAQQAEAAGLLQQPDVQSALRLAQERVLSDIWLRKLDAQNTPNQEALEAFARTAYNARLNEWQVGERVRARHILVRQSTENAREKAEDLLTQLKNGADFAALAREHSQDPGSASEGGDLGAFERGRMIPVFEETAFGMQQPGELSGIVESAFGFHIIQLQERLPAGPRPFEEVKPQLVEEARRTIINNGRVNIQDSILQNRTVNQEAIQAFIESQRAKAAAGTPAY